MPNPACFVARRAPGADLGVVLPKDLVRFLDAVRGGAVADFVARPQLPKLAALLAAAAARKDGAGRAKLVALLAGAIPFGETSDGEVLAYFVGDDPAGAHVIATVHPPQVVCRGAAELAVICMMHANDAEPPIAVPGIAEEGAFRHAIARGELRAELLLGSHAEIRAATKALASRRLDLPPAARAKTERDAPLAFGAVVEAFFRGEDVSAHATSADRLTAEGRSRFWPRRKRSPPAAPSRRRRSPRPSACSRATPRA